MMASASSSRLLRLLDELNDSEWNQLLLPRLVDNGSIGSWALACRRLKEMAHRFVQQVQLDATACEHMSTLEKLHMHFPAVKKVYIILEATQEATMQLPELLLAITRLPKFRTLSLELEGEASHPSTAALSLQMLRMAQLTALQHLHLLSLSRSWDDGRQAWLVLGKLTQLRTLAVSFDPAVTAPINVEHLSALSSLKSLQCLTIVANQMKQQQPQQDESYQFLAQLTGLTCLAVPLVRRHSALAQILPQLCKLRHLMLASHRDQYDQYPKLESQEWAALAGLTQLTQLWLQVRLPQPPADGSQSVFLQALQSLQQLQVLHIDAKLQREALPVLAGLKQLTRLECEWDKRRQPAAPTAAGNHCKMRCCSVATVNCAGSVPWRAFSRATRVQQEATWQPADLLSISKHLRRLQVLTVADTLTTDDPSLDPAACASKRAAAVASVSSLKHLRSLAVCLTDDGELAALTAVVALQKLRILELAVWASHECTCTFGGLITAVGGCDLSYLDVALPLTFQVTAAQAQQLLGSLRGVQKLVVTAAGAQYDAFADGWAAAREAQQPVPGTFHLFRMEWDERSEEEEEEEEGSASSL